MWREKSTLLTHFLQYQFMHFLRFIFWRKPWTSMSYQRSKSSKTRTSSTSFRSTANSLTLNGFITVAFLTGDCPQSVNTELRKCRKIGSFFGAEKSAAVKMSDVGLTSPCVSANFSVVVFDFFPIPSLYNAHYCFQVGRHTAYFENPMEKKRVRVCIQKKRGLYDN